jgi:glycosyltransferase involved in cell wall biosynthesis
MSNNEGLPISIIEGMAGLQIISTKIAGMPEMLDYKYNVFLIEPREDELLNLFKSLNDYDLKNLVEIL